MSLGITAIERLYCPGCGIFKPETDFSLISRAQARAEEDEARCLDCVDKAWKARIGRSEIKQYIEYDRERILQRTRNPEFEEMVGEKRLGTVMHSSEFITKLHKLLPNLVVRSGNIEGDLSLYRVYGDQVDFICYTNSGFLPEFSIVEFNKDRQPIHERRGWRTVLLRIIRFGLLTEKEVEAVFGRPTFPQEARFWDRSLYFFRNNRTEG